MLKKASIFIFFFFLYTLGGPLGGKAREAWALTELGLDFSYGKQFYGVNRQNTSVQRGYSGSMALYLLSFMALELNISEQRKSFTEVFQIPIPGFNVTKKGAETRINSTLYGAGLRLALTTSPRAFLRPLVSFGYAKQLIVYENEGTYRNDSNGEVFVLSSPQEKIREDSIFASFMLQLKMARQVALKLAIKTVFPSEEMDKAKDSILYSAGLTFAL